MKKRRWFPKVKIFHVQRYATPLSYVPIPNTRRLVVQVGLTQYGSIWDALKTELLLKWVWKWNHHRTMQNIALGGCERCGSFWKMAMVPSMTCYHWDGKGEDPNKDVRLCPLCEETHVEYWEGMWRDYYGGRL